VYEPVLCNTIGRHWILNFILKRLEHSFMKVCRDVYWTLSTSLRITKVNVIRDRFIYIIIFKKWNLMWWWLIG